MGIGASFRQAGEGLGLAAIDPATGSILRQARVEGAIDDYYASPVAVDGRIYLTNSATGGADLWEVPITRANVEDKI